MEKSIPIWNEKLKVLSNMCVVTMKKMASTTVLLNRLDARLIWMTLHFIIPILNARMHFHPR